MHSGYDVFTAFVAKVHTTLAAQMGKVYTHTEFEHYLSIAIAANGILQLLLDIIMEALHIVPTRINHLSLTVLNAFLAWKTLSAIQKDKFRFLHEDCQVLFLMELFLIAGDVYYLIADEFSYHFIYARLFFIICSSFNFFAVIYIMNKYGLWSLSYQGDIEESGVVDTVRDQSLSIFYRPSLMRQSEAAEYDKDVAEMRNFHTSSARPTSSPMECVEEEEDDRESKPDEADNNL